MKDALKVIYLNVIQCSSVKQTLSLSLSILMAIFQVDLG